MVMQVDLTDSQRQLQEEAIRFARTALTSDMRQRDREQLFDRDGWRLCADFGLLRMPIPEAYGGLGLGLSDLIAVMEGLGYAARDRGLLFSMNAHLWTASIPILLRGTEEQRRRFLPGLSDGSRIAANGSSEAEAGSDVFAMQTLAERRDDVYILNGAKTFVTNAPVADLFVVYATIDRALGPMGVTAFLIERDAPGLALGKPLEKMGLRTSPMSEVVFTDCVVPAQNRLGREGRGAEVFSCSMEWERGCILATALGTMRGLLERCTQHARDRKQFGKPIGKFQSVSNRLVDMKVRLDACRPLVYRVGQLKDESRPSVVESAVAKLFVSECYVQSCLDAVQVFGGYGYMTEQEIERELRDAVGSTLYSGTSEIQRNIIARGLGL
jgi:alkylation response protein AidB-like acyl-CoA dehydrogenase